MAAKIFGVVKNNGNYCEIRYSWYIKHHHTLMRLSTRARVVSQMNRVVSDHIDSGFVTKVEYRAMRDEQGQADFIIRYYPGPEAKQSVKRVLAFINTSTWPLLVERRREKAKSRKQKNETNADAEILSAQTGDTETGAIQLPSTGSDAILLPAPQPASVIQTEAEAQVDETLLAVLTQRGGIGEKKSRALLSNLKPDQQVIDQLEWGEHQVRTNPSKFTNPAGFYIHLIEENLPVPATFETSRKRANRLEEEQRRREVERLEREYETYKRAELDRYITEHPHQFGATKETTTKEVIERYGHFAPTMAMVESLATIEARFEIAKKVTMLSFEEFIKADKAERANAVVQVAPQPTTGTDLNEPAEQAVAAEPSTQPVSGTDGNQEAGEVVTETEGQEELSSPQHQDVASEPAIDPVPPHTDSGTGLSASTSIEPPNSN